MKTVYSRTLSLLALALAALPANAQYGFNSVADSGTITGTSATTFSSANRTFINNNGDIAFTATVSNNRTVYKNIAGINTVVAAQGGNTAYGSTYGANIDGLNVTLNDAGLVTFRGDAAVGETVTAANNSAIVRDATIVSREGSTAIEGSTPSTFGNYSANNAATTVYAGALNAGGNGLFSVSGGGTATRIVSSATPTGITGATFNAFLFPSLDNAENVSFQATLSGTGVPSNALFNRTATGTVTKIAAVGETVPGGTNTYTSFAGIARGDNGTIGVNAVSNGLRGIYVGSGDALTVRAALQGQTILDATYGSGFSLGNVNASGIGVFRATNMTGAFTDAIFTFNSTGQVSKVLSSADQVFGTTVSGFGVPTINNAGQIAFNYTFAGTGGRQGVFVGAVTVPEAGTVSLLLAGAATLGTAILRRRK